MSHDRHARVTCQICGQSMRPSQGFPASMVRTQLLEAIHADHPDLPPDAFICFDDLARYRSQHLEVLLRQERGEVSQLEAQVLSSLQQQEVLARDVDKESDAQRTVGDRLADRVARFGGSWAFIIAFGAVLVLWVLVNAVGLMARPFDPYPYILLNLVLSCVAAIQAPVIMMSQNRQEAKDRKRGKNDYLVNLKAELEIRHLHSKIDVLLNHVWQHHMEVQNGQLDLMQLLRGKRS